MCLDDQILSTYMDGELEEPWRSQVAEHLTYCTSCKSRLKSLESLRSKIKDAALSDEEIKKHQDRVLSMLEQNILNKPKKKFSFSKQIKFTVLEVMGAAAAFVIVFVGSWSLFGKKNTTNVIQAPETKSVIEIENITPVKTTEVVQKGIESYSVEEIMSYLDRKGYDVVITLKGIQPIQEDVQPIIEEIPVVVVEQPVVEVIPAPVVEEAPVVVEQPVVEVAPVVVEQPVVEEAPVVVEQPVVEETLAPVVVEQPVVEEAPAPVVEETPVVVDQPVVEETPAPVIVEQPAVEEAPTSVVEETQVVVDQPAVEVITQ